MWGLCRICIRTYRARTRHRVLLCYPSKNIRPSGVWQPRNDTPLGTSPHCSQLGQAQTIRHPSHSAQRPAGISAGRSRDLLTHERGDRPVRLRVASGCFFFEAPAPQSSFTSFTNGRFISRCNLTPCKSWFLFLSRLPSLRCYGCTCELPRMSFNCVASCLRSELVLREAPGLRQSRRPPATRHLPRELRA